MVVSGATDPVSCVHRLPVPPIALTPPGNIVVADALDPPGQRVRRDRSPARRAGRTASGKTAPLTRNSAPATASGYDHDSWRVCRQTAASMTPIATIATMPEGHDDGEADPVDGGRVERDAEEHDADRDGDDRAHRPDGDPGHAAAEQVEQEVGRADVGVLEHPVALAVVEDGPGEAGDPGEHERPERRPDDDEAAVLRILVARDDAQHHDEDERRRDRLRDRVDEEQERVRPVGLHLPAEADRRAEPAPGRSGSRIRGARRVEAAPLRRGEAGRSRRVTVRRPGPQRRGHCQRTERLPTRRARRSRAASMTRANSVNPIVIAMRMRDLDLDGRRPGRERRADEGELAHRIEPDRQRDRRDREGAEQPQAHDREVEAGHEVDRLDEQLVELERLTAPHEVEPGHDHARGRTAPRGSAGRPRSAGTTGRPRR